MSPRKFSPFWAIRGKEKFEEEPFRTENPLKKTDLEPEAKKPTHETQGAGEKPGTIFHPNSKKPFPKGNTVFV